MPPVAAGGFLFLGFEVLGLPALVCVSLDADMACPEPVGIGEAALLLEVVDGSHGDLQFPGDVFQTNPLIHRNPFCRLVPVWHYRNGVRLP
jgi:hypothetical protein